MSVDYCLCCGEGYAEGRDEPADAQELLFAAFLKGFEQSCEGFNGEYVGERFRGKDGVIAPAFLDEIRPGFEQWLKELAS